MNNAIIFSAGLTLGTMLGFLVGKHTYETKAAKEIQEMREHYREKLEKIPLSIPDKPSPRDLVKRYEEEEMIDRDVNYDEVEGPPDEPSEDVDDYEPGENDNYVYDEPERSQGDDQPKLIPVEEFGAIPTFDEVSLLYYQGNDILTTDSDEVVEDRDAMVGNCMTKFGFEDSDEKSIYVRNYEQETDYEIIKIFGDFVP